MLKILVILVHISVYIDLTLSNANRLVKLFFFIFRVVFPWDAKQFLVIFSYQESAFILVQIDCAWNYILRLENSGTLDVEIVLTKLTKIASPIVYHLFIFLMLPFSTITHN